MTTSARVSPVTGHYVTFDVDDPDLGGEYKVFYLENGQGRPTTPRCAARHSKTASCAMSRPNC